MQDTLKRYFRKLPKERAIDAMEARKGMVDCYYLYFILEKEETLNSFKKQFPNLLSSVQIEFRETEK